MARTGFESNLNDWENLLNQVRELAHKYPYLESFRIELEEAAGKARAAKAQQMALQAASQQATHQVATALVQGRDAAIRMRSYLRGCLGFRNEELVRFGVAPIRKRGPRKVRTQV
ncbi:MAG TPA: hypothetical protein VEL74_24100 [Thermoanaerobaculia bacterium]|nr:hypothetical protein [Thermoanaerobaculia bacterium]